VLSRLLLEWIAVFQMDQEFPELEDFQRVFFLSITLFGSDDVFREMLFRVSIECLFDHLDD
jgi:hypothetical protein